MKGLKILVGVVVALVVLAAIAVVAVFLSVNSIAKSAVEKGGSYAMGVPTTLSSANVGVFSGEFSMSGLRVANPQGFPGPHFLTLGDGEVAVSLGTLQQETVELPRLTLDAIDVRLEKKGGQSNYQVILANLKKLSGPEKKPAPEGEGKKFVINELAITDVTVHVDMLEAPGGIGQLAKVTVPIEEIRLQNVGRTGSGVGGTGVTMGELAGIVVKAVLASAAQNGGGLIPADVLGDLQGQLAQLGDLGGSLQEMGLQVVGDVQGTVEQVGKQAEAVVDEAKKAADEAKKKLEDAGKGLKDLIPK